MDSDFLQTWQVLSELRRRGQISFVIKENETISRVTPLLPQVFILIPRLYPRQNTKRFFETLWETEQELWELLQAIQRDSLFATSQTILLLTSVDALFNTWKLSAAQVNRERLLQTFTKPEILEVVVDALLVFGFQLYVSGFVAGTLFPEDLLIMVMKSRENDQISARIVLVNVGRLIPHQLVDRNLMPYQRWPFSHERIRENLALYTYPVLRMLTGKVWVQRDERVYVHASSFDFTASDITSILGMIYCWITEFPLNTPLGWNLALRSRNENQITEGKQNVEDYENLIESSKIIQREEEKDTNVVELKHIKKRIVSKYGKRNESKYQKIVKKWIFPGVWIQGGKSEKEIRDVWSLLMKAKNFDGEDVRFLEPSIPSLDTQRDLGFVTSFLAFAIFRPSSQKRKYSMNKGGAREEEQKEQKERWFEYRPAKILWQLITENLPLLIALYDLEKELIWDSKANTLVTTKQFDDFLLQTSGTNSNFDVFLKNGYLRKQIISSRKRKWLSRIFLGLVAVSLIGKWIYAQDELWTLPRKFLIKTIYAQPFFSVPQEDILRAKSQDPNQHSQTWHAGELRRQKYETTERWFIENWINQRNANNFLSHFESFMRFANTSKKEIHDKLKQRFSLENLRILRDSIEDDPAPLFDPENEESPDESPPPTPPMEPPEFPESPPEEETPFEPPKEETKENRIMEVKGNNVTILYTNMYLQSSVLEISKELWWTKISQNGIFSKGYPYLRSETIQSFPGQDFPSLKIPYSFSKNVILEKFDKSKYNTGSSSSSSSLLLQLLRNIQSELYQLHCNGIVYNCLLTSNSFVCYSGVDEKIPTNIILTNFSQFSVAFRGGRFWQEPSEKVIPKEIVFFTSSYERLLQLGTVPALDYIEFVEFFITLFVSPIQILKLSKISQELKDNVSKQIDAIVLEIPNEEIKSELRTLGNGLQMLNSFDLTKENGNEFWKLGNPFGVFGTFQKSPEKSYTLHSGAQEQQQHSTSKEKQALKDWITSKAISKGLRNWIWQKWYKESISMSALLVILTVSDQIHTLTIANPPVEIDRLYSELICSPLWTSSVSSLHNLFQEKLPNPTNEKKYLTLLLKVTQVLDITASLWTPFEEIVKERQLRNEIYKTRQVPDKLRDSRKKFLDLIIGIEQAMKPQLMLFPLQDINEISIKLWKSFEVTLRKLNVLEPFWENWNIQRRKMEESKKRIEWKQSFVNKSKIETFLETMYFLQNPKEKKQKRPQTRSRKEIGSDIEFQFFQILYSQTQQSQTWIPLFNWKEEKSILSMGIWNLSETKIVEVDLRLKEKVFGTLRRFHLLPGQIFHFFGSGSQPKIFSISFRIFLSSLPCEILVVKTS
jgi:hypothetical protein